MIRKSVSLVIPMFNEESNIEHAIAYAIEALQAHTDDWEIIIVDDASTDQSPEIVRKVARDHPRIRLIQHQFNRKLGSSLKTGFASAGKQLVLYMDADLPFDPDVLGRAIRAMDVTRADLIAGYRFDRTTEGWKRSLYSWGYNLLIRVLFGISHRDINFSFKLMRRELLEAVDLRSEGSLIDAELVVKSRNLGFRIQQLGLDYFPRAHGDSTLSSPGIILKILKELVKLYPDMRHPKRRSEAQSSIRAQSAERRAQSN